MGVTAVRVVGGTADFKVSDPSLTPSTNAALDSLSTIVPKVAKPAYDPDNGKFVFDLGATNNLVLYKLCFFGTDAADETGLARVRVWHEARTEDTSSSPSMPPLYIPEELLNLSITLGTAATANNVGQFTTNMLFADTITITNDYTRGELAALSGPSASNVVQYVVFDAQGGRYLEVETATGGSATSLLPMIFPY